MIFDVSTSPDRVPFPAVLEALPALARRAGVDVLLVGATARDVALAAEGHDRPLRATNDVDVAVAVADQGGFDAFTAGLSPSESGTPHKFVVGGVDVDVVPFGGVEGPDRTIVWPDGTTMNTLGFAEALACAIELKLSASASVYVASLAAQAALKTFAWVDRGSWTDRDAVDLKTLLLAYSSGGRLDEVYAEERYELLASYDYEVRPVGAYLLGAELRADLGAEVGAGCIAVLTGEPGTERLATAMRGDFGENVHLVEAMSAGIGASS